MSLRLRLVARSGARSTSGASTWPASRSPQVLEELKDALFRVRGVEAVAERPDGTRVPFVPFPTPLRDPTGKVVGAINASRDEQLAARLRQLMQD